jgi:hypothetical protein
MATYKAAMYHCWFAYEAAKGNNDSPIDDVTAHIVIGPMKRSKNPISPVIPKSIWKEEATMIDPETYMCI